ncbi:MAG: metallopeptidase TldD-related protein, partial [Propionibacteriaceae bacterium]
LLWPMFDMMSERDAREGQSVFAGPELGHTRVGEQISSLPITISTDPHAPGIEVAPFACVTSPLPGFASVFDNGIDVGRVEWFTEGKLTQLAAVRSQLPAGATLPYVSDNMIVDGGSTTTIDEMIASTRKGLLVTCLWYIRTVDPSTALLTGLTRDGVYVIEDGVIVGAANNFRWNESPVSLLRRVSEVSQAQHCLCREWNDWFTRSVVPAFRIPDFQMSTVSQAI